VCEHLKYVYNAKSVGEMWARPTDHCYSLYQCLHTQIDQLLSPKCEPNCQCQKIRHYLMSQNGQIYAPDVNIYK